MAKRALSIMTVILAITAGTLAYAENPVSRWDAGLMAGTALYSDVVGFNSMLETRVYLWEPITGFSLFAGAGGLFQYTSNARHTMTGLYGFGLGGVDWFFPGRLAPVLEPLALRAQVALGGGYMSDLNSDDQKTGNASFLVLPAIGADYGFGRLHASLMFGYELKVADELVLGAMTASLGLSYSIR
jgi:hypothetical protein